MSRKQNKRNKSVTQTNKQNEGNKQFSVLSIFFSSYHWFVAVIIANMSVVKQFCVLVSSENIVTLQEQFIFIPLLPLCLCAYDS